MRDPLDKFLVLVESLTHLSKMSLVWTKLLRCNNKYITCLSLVLKDKPWTIVSEINQCRINLDTYLPIIGIIRTIFVHCNHLNTPSLESSDLRMTSHMTRILPNINNHKIEHTWVTWSCFSGDITNETWSGRRICEIAIARVFPEPVPDITFESKPASSARAACSWSCLGTMVFSLSTKTIRHALKTTVLSVRDKAWMNSAGGIRLQGIGSSTATCSCPKDVSLIVWMTVCIWEFHGSIIASRNGEEHMDNTTRQGITPMQTE